MDGLGRRLEMCNVNRIGGSGDMYCCEKGNIVKETEDNCVCVVE